MSDIACTPDESFSRLVLGNSSGCVARSPLARRAFSWQREACDNWRNLPLAQRPYRQLVLAAKARRVVMLQMPASAHLGDRLGKPQWRHMLCRTGAAGGMNYSLAANAGCLGRTLSAIAHRLG